MKASSLMLRTAGAFLILGTSVRPAILAPSEDCTDKGEVSDPDTDAHFTAQGGETCDEFQFSYGGATFGGGANDICPAILIYTPECRKSGPKTDYNVAGFWRFQTKWQPECVCKLQLLICLDWECEVGSPVPFSAVYCYTEYPCGSDPPPPPPDAGPQGSLPTGAPVPPGPITGGPRVPKS